MSFWKILRGTVLFAFYAAYGVLTLVVGLVRAVRRLMVIGRLCQDKLTCPACRAKVSTLGRWTCGTCSSVYLGSATVCPNCRSTAAHFPCRCGATIPLEPWR